VPRKRKETIPSPAPIPGPPVIIPTAVYTYESALAALAAVGLRESSLQREVKKGRLRVHKRLNRNFFLGQDLLDWLSNAGPGAPPKRKGDVPRPPGRRRQDRPPEEGGATDSPGAVG
jgi:hypothetical protein